MLSHHQIATRRAGNLSGIAAILLWSTTVALVRALSEQVGPLTAATAGYLIGGVFCLVRRYWQNKSAASIIAQPRAHLISCGCLFVLNNAATCLAIGLATTRNQAVEVGLINSLWPAFTVLFAIPILRKRGNYVLLGFGTLLALVGSSFSLTHATSVSLRSFWENYTGNVLAYTLALVAAVTWGLYSNLTRRWAPPQSDGAVDFFIPTTGLLLLCVRLCSTEHTFWNGTAVLEAILLGGVTAVAYGLWETAMLRGNLLLVATGSYFTPLLSMLASCIYLKVALTSRLGLGCVLLVIGSLISWRAMVEKIRRGDPILQPMQAPGTSE